MKYPPFLFIFVFMNKALIMLESGDTDIILLGCNILYNMGCGIHYIKEVCPIRIELDLFNHQVIKYNNGCKSCKRK